MAGPKCRVTEQNGTVTLHAPSFAYELDMCGPVTAQSWRNKLADQTVSLGDGEEFSVDVDASEDRIPITGWRTATISADSIDAELPEVYRGFETPYFDDSAWDSQTTPYPADLARTHMFLPRAANGSEIGLTLGGIGLFDAREMRVFINGAEIGTRSNDGRWSHPSTFTLAPDTSEYDTLRFRQDNVVALRLAQYRTRTERLNDLDPRQTSHLNKFGTWNAQFEQYLTVGRGKRRVSFEVTGHQQTGPGELTVDLRSDDEALAARLMYEWSADEPTLSKELEIENIGFEEVRVMDLHLGTYQTDVEVTDGERGFPVYLSDDRFVSIAHPSGWTIGKQGTIELLRERADCFRNPRFVLGNPWEEGPYGYCCTDGERAFVAVNNCTWSDRTVTLRLNEDWGLPDQSEWELYRWHPEPAKLQRDRGPIRETVAFSLRPFEIVLLEVVQAGDQPSLGKSFPDEPLPTEFTEQSCAVSVTANSDSATEPATVPREQAERPDDVIHGDRWPAQLPDKRVVTVSGEAPASWEGGVLVLTAQLRTDSLPADRWDLGKDFAVDVTIDDR